MILEFHALSLMAEVGVAVAGFATIAGVIRHDALHADAIYDVVLHSLTAVFFSILVVTLAGSGGLERGTLRLVASALAVVALFSSVRELRVFASAQRELDEEKRHGGVGRVLGFGSLIAMIAAPVPSGLVVADAVSDAALVFELAILTHLAAAMLLLLYLVWYNFALEAPGGGDGAEP